MCHACSSYKTVARESCLRSRSTYGAATVKPMSGQNISAKHFNKYHPATDKIVHDLVLVERPVKWTHVFWNTFSVTFGSGLIFDCWNRLPSLTIWFRLRRQRRSAHWNSIVDLYTSYSLPTVFQETELWNAITYTTRRHSNNNEATLERTPTRNKTRLIWLSM